MNESMKQALAIVERAENEKRHLTSEERSTIETALAETKAAKADAEMKASVRELITPAPAAGGTLFAAYKALGWEPGVRDLRVPYSQFKTASFSGDPDDIAPARFAGVPLGADIRYLAAAFPSQDMSATDTSAQVLEQLSRDLADPDDMRRSISETGLDKPETSSVMSLDDRPLEQIASVSSGIPNIIMRNPAFADVVNIDLRLAYDAGVDAACAEGCYADADTFTGGSDTWSTIRKAITAITNSGYNPTHVALSPNDAEALDLLQTEGPEAEYYSPGAFAGAPFGLKRIVSPAVTDGGMLVFDANSAGKLFASPVELLTADDNIKRNTSIARLEGNALFAVQRAPAIVTPSA